MRWMLWCVLVATASWPGWAAAQSANAVPKYDGSGNLTPSVVSDVGGLVGIGTTTPQQFLDVAGSTWIHADGGVNIQRSHTGAAAGMKRFQDTVYGGKWYFGPVTDDNAGWVATSLVLDHAGNVGAGVSQPQYPLHVAGTATASYVMSTY